jgi:hypothetical protein
LPTTRSASDTSKLYAFGNLFAESVLFTLQSIGVDAHENGVAIVTRDATKNPRGVAKSMKTVNLKRGTSARKAASIASNAASKTRPDLRSVRPAE